MVEPAIQIPENAETGLKRALGPFHLITLGIGAIIGAGIFVLTGHAAAQFAGPGRGDQLCHCGAGLPVRRSVLQRICQHDPGGGQRLHLYLRHPGRFLAWIIGWNLVLEYLATSATVAVGWSGYFGNFLASFGISVPHAFGHRSHRGRRRRPHDDDRRLVQPACHAAGRLCTIFLVIGVKTSANFNNVMVTIKLAIVLAVIFVGFGHVVPANHAPFIPPNTGTFGQFGWTGVFRATGVIFFAYIGFDAVSVAGTGSQEPSARCVPSASWDRCCSVPRSIC